MKVRDYLKGALPEALIVWVVALSLGYLFSTAFNAPEGLAHVLALDAATCAVLVAALYAIAYSKRTALVGGVALGAVLLACFAAALALGGGANVLSDYEGNLFLFEAVVVLTCLACFLLSRRRVGAIVLVVAGAFSYGVVQYLYLEGHVAAFLVFLASGIALVMYRTYRAGLAGSVTRRTSFVPMFAFASVLALVAVGAAAGVFYLVIEPLGPTAQDIKLITEYRALEELPRRGTNQELAITDPDMTSTVLNGEYADADQDDSDLDTETDPQGNTIADTLNSAMQAIGSAMGIDLENGSTSLLDLITFDKVTWWQWLVLAIVVIALVAGPIAAKLALRRRFLEKALAMPPCECVETLYTRFMRDFKRLGVVRGAHATPYEFAYETRDALAGFSDNEANASFTRLTVTFVEASFGEHEPDAAALNEYRCFYEAFFKNSRKLVGTPKYLRLFYRL